MSLIEEKVSDLKTGLKSRHITMMSIAGVIGGTLFVGSGSVIHSAGPAAILAYILGGLILLLIMRMLGEMAVATPDTGSFSTYADKSIGRWAGFTIGWMYWLFWGTVMAWEAFVAGNILNVFFPAISSNWLVLIVTLALLVVNFFNVKNYGEFEFWFALIKVIAIVSFIALGFLVVFNIYNIEAPHGISNFTAQGFMPNGIAPVFGAVLGVMFAFVGAEIATIAASETENPAREIKKTNKTIVWRICIFYIGSIFFLICIVPWNDPLLGQSGYGAYRRALEIIGIPGAQTLMNIVVLTSLSSCLISAHYAGSRMLYSLALRGDAPAILKKTTQKTGVPIAAVLATSVIAVTFSLINLNPAFSSKDMLITLMNLTGAIGLLIYLVIACSQLKMRKQLEAKGVELEIKMWLYPWLTWAVIVFIILFLIGMLFIEEYRLLVGSTAMTMAGIAMVGIIKQIKSKVAKPPVITEFS